MKVVKGFFLVALVAAFAVASGQIASAELIAHYEFNEALGVQTTLADSSGYGHTLTQVETAGQGAVVYDDFLGGNVLYNPNGSSYKLTPTSVLDMPAGTSITLAGWFKQTVSDGTSAYIYGIYLGQNGSEPIASLGFHRDGSIWSFIETDAGDVNNVGNLDQMDVYTAPGTIALDASYAFDAWHHVAVVYDFDADLAKIYVDGSAVYTESRENKTITNVYTDGSIAYLQDETYGFSFASGPDGGIYNGGVGGYQGGDTVEFIGYLDDLRIYNSALTATQVASLVPEPGAILLILSGALGLLACRRRK